MATIVRPDLHSYIYGFIDSGRYDNPYKDLNEVLNFIGVLSKRDNIPFCRFDTCKPDKEYRHSYCAKIYHVPKNWRDCLYEDLINRHFYIISPSQENVSEDSEHVFSWVVFRVTDLIDGLEISYWDKNDDFIVKKVYHSGRFIDLIKRRDINEVLDTLAVNEKSIKISVQETIRDKKGSIVGTICRFDLD